MKTKKQLLFYAALGAAILLAGCDNPSGSSGSSAGGGTPGNTVGIEIGLSGGTLTVTGNSGNNVIYTDREPSLLELRVTGEGWTGLKWSVDGRSLGTGETLTMNAADYSEARHTVVLTGVRGGVSYAAAIPVTVARERAAVIWTQTAEDSSLTTFDLSAWQGENGPAETWSLSVLEQPVVYFAVRKPPQAVIAVQNIAGAAVSKALPGETLDGSFADEFLDLFTVTPGPDAAFGDGEGECRFTLVVSDPGRAADKTVNVKVAVRPNLTGVAVFHRNTEGGLTRISPANAADHANSLYTSHKSGGFPAWGIDFAYVQNLSTALKWLDSYTLSGTPQVWAEYLVRVEADEAMPKTLLTCRMNGYTPLAEYIRIRIRGYGGERKLTHNPLSMDTGGVLKGTSGMNANQAFLSIGPQTDSTYVPNHLELRLENNITIDAASGTNPYFPDGALGPLIMSMVHVGRGNTLVMEAGSKLTNYKWTQQGMAFHYNATAVTVQGGLFELRGGEISNIDIQGQTGNIVLCYEQSGYTPAGLFYYYNGVFSGNTGGQIAVGSYFNPSFYDVTDPRFAPVP